MPPGMRRPSDARSRAVCHNTSSEEMFHKALLMKCLLVRPPARIGNQGPDVPRTRMRGEPKLYGAYYTRRRVRAGTPCRRSEAYTSR